MRGRVAAGGLSRGKVHRLFNEMPSVKSRFFAVCCLFAGLLSCAAAYAALPAASKPAALPAASKPAAKPMASAPAVSVVDKLAEAQQALDQLETIKLDKLPAGVTRVSCCFVAPCWNAWWRPTPGSWISRENAIRG